MTFNEQIRSKISLIPLNIDTASILTLSNGVIFNTIIHNVKHTLSNRDSNFLPWKLTDMFLICDPKKNKTYLQKLQKMQSISSSISTQIYHSKLMQNQSGLLTTLGREIYLYKKLTGIIISRSIDELLSMESKSTVHFIQYKLLIYKNIPTYEIIPGPGLLFKTVFDFDLNENNNFPRQLLPIAIITFTRQDNCNLYSSIENFFHFSEHKIFDKSYSIDHIEEEKQAIYFSKINTNSITNTQTKLQCFVKLNRLDLSLYNISNLSLIKNQERFQQSSLPLKYQCSVLLSRIDTTIYNIDPPANSSDMGIQTNELLSQQQIKLVNIQEQTNILNNEKDCLISPSVPCITYSEKLPSSVNDSTMCSIKMTEMNDIISQDCMIIDECKDNKNDNPVNSHHSSIFLSTFTLIKIIIPERIRNKQNRFHNTITFNQYELTIPLFSYEPLVDPRLKYRLQSITIDHHWPSSCYQCLILSHLPPLFSSSTQMMSYTQKSSFDYIDPRRQSLKIVILNYIYNRMKNFISYNLNEFKKILFEQTIFKTNCSIHLEYLLLKLKQIDNKNFFYFIKYNEHFQLSSLLLKF